jgi:hypothetical protein
MALGLFPRANLTAQTAHLTGAPTAILEFWARRSVEMFETNVHRLFPRAFAKR